MGWLSEYLAGIALAVIGLAILALFDLDRLGVTVLALAAIFSVGASVNDRRRR